MVPPSLLFLVDVGHETDIKGCSKGCGRFFEGNGAEMHKALNETLAALPDETRVFVSLLFSDQSLSQ